MSTVDLKKQPFFPLLPLVLIIIGIGYKLFSLNNLAFTRQQLSARLLYPEL